jgi:hypothetical protein
VRATLLHDGREIELDLAKPRDDAKSFSGALTLSGIKEGVRDGPARLQIQVQDRSIWGSRRSLEHAVVVDSKVPDLEILAAPRSLSWGESGLVVYKVIDSSLASTGVSFKGATPAMAAPISMIEPTLSQDNIFAMLIAGTRERSITLEVFARDVANHTSSTSVQMSGLPHVTSERRIKDAVPEPVFNGKIASVSDEALKFIAEADRPAMQALRSKVLEGDRRATAVLASSCVTTVRRQELELIQSRLNADPKIERQWSGAMSTAAVRVKARFGDQIAVGDGQVDLVSWVSEGEILDTLGNNSAVVAPYPGRVRFAGQLPTFGEVVAIDHGAGLASVFYSLDQREVFEGASVTAGQLIARVGSSGLHFSKALRMLLLVNGTPIDPAPWRDGDVFGSNFQGVLDGVKTLLGIESPPLN